MQQSGAQFMRHGTIRSAHEPPWRLKGALIPEAAASECAPAAGYSTRLRSLRERVPRPCPTQSARASAARSIAARLRFTHPCATREPPPRKQCIAGRFRCAVGFAPSLALHAGATETAFAVSPTPRCAVAEKPQPCGGCAPADPSPRKAVPIGRLVAARARKSARPCLRRLKAGGPP